MGEVWFYHLTERPAEDVLPVLLGRALSSGARVELRGADPKRMARLDEVLWLGDEAGFLPHGMAGGPHDALQPVLLTVAGQAPANGAGFLLSVDGAEVLPDEARNLKRVMILFDGNDTAALDHARSQWRQMVAAGLGAQYWAQEGGRWVKKQERKPGGEGT